MFKKFHPFIFLIFLTGCAASQPVSSGEKASENNGQCLSSGQWAKPLTQQALSGKQVTAQAIKDGIVLLGETHTNADHHRWQLHTIAALHNEEPNMVLGFEAFPRRYQSVLDRWVKGDLSEREFLKQVNWEEVWRYDSHLYMPLFHFARLNKVSMIALNIDRELVSKTAKTGWAKVPVEDREGISDPASAPLSLRRRLEPIFKHHKTSTSFDFFIDSMLVWDRAMAEALWSARNAKNNPLVVGVVGNGHSQYGDNISRQLAELGHQNTSVLIPWDTNIECTELTDENGRAIADAVFSIPANKISHKPKGPQLGVMIKSGDIGVIVDHAVPESLAEKSGILAEDIITSAAGISVTKTDELIPIIKRQAPGTWLPLTLIREGKKMELVIKFPAVTESKN